MACCGGPRKPVRAKFSLLPRRTSSWRLPRALPRILAEVSKRTSCGVIVTDGQRILLGHATRSPRWDIPKGIAEPGETFASAAGRELLEETGLMVPATELRDLGLHAYLRDKDLA